VLVQEGAEPDRAYVIRRGEAEVRKAQKDGHYAVIARLGPGDWVGEMGLLLNLPRSASVVAVGDLEVEPMTRENFEHLIGAHPDEALRLMKQLANRLHQADQRHTL
jgi:CRP-like cAMP-binding protein